MKYKKLLVLITCLLFVTVAVFCFASAFKVTDIELKVNAIENSKEDLPQKCESLLKRYEGENLVFLSEENVKNQLNSLSGYVNVKSVKKEFPNRLVVNVEENVEAFSLQSGENFYALDVNFTVLAIKNSATNNVDGKDNVLLSLSPSDYDDNFAVGKPINVYDKATLNYLKNVSTTLYSYRKDLRSVAVTVKKDGIEYKTMVLEMKEGVKFTIVKADVLTSEKLIATYEFYLALENKGVGEYIVVLEDNGNITIKQ